MNRPTLSAKNSIIFRNKLADKTKKGIKYRIKPIPSIRYSVYSKRDLQHLGLEHIVERTLERMGPVEKILLIGDYAKGLILGP